MTRTPVGYEAEFDTRSVIGYEVEFEFHDERITPAMRSFYVEEKSGKLFIHTAHAPKPEIALLCCMADGIDFVEARDSIYIDADWMGQEYPDTRRAIERIKQIYQEIL